MDDTTGTTPEAPEARPAPPAPPGAPQDLDSNTKLIALLGWIFAPLGVIAIFMDPYKDNAWLRQHVIQAAGVWLIGAVLSSVTFGIAWVIVFIYQIVMALKANKGDSVEVPLVYGLVKGMINP
ncbi:MAG: hypothetical protein CVT60_00485 [Actinobacteria bacterium HGW-Actinobacteria-10]|jgi:hypothetical protein|nr:MAG: hypothetical protein CVT60_00485 [Actinobacteria bacterium HGW-Actinobacteria-10]